LRDRERVLYDLSFKTSVDATPQGTQRAARVAEGQAGQSVNRYGAMRPLLHNLRGELRCEVVQGVHSVRREPMRFCSDREFHFSRGSDPCKIIDEESRGQGLTYEASNRRQCGLGRPARSRAIKKTF